MRKTEEILEFDKIKELWANLAVTEASRDKIRNASFFLSESELRKQIKDTTNSRKLMECFGAPPLQNAEEIREILAETGHITEILVETRNTGFHVAHLRTDHDNIYEVSGSVFSAFAKKKKPLFEMAVKKANLEDVFMELTENSKDPAEKEEPEEVQKA